MIEEEQTSLDENNSSRFPDEQQQHYLIGAQIFKKTQTWWELQSGLENSLQQEILKKGVSNFCCFPTLQLSEGNARESTVSFYCYRSTVCQLLWYLRPNNLNSISFYFKEGQKGGKKHQLVEQCKEQFYLIKMFINQIYLQCKHCTTIKIIFLLINKYIELFLVYTFPGMY